MIEVKDLKVEKQGHQILKGITFSALPGQITGMVGPNGAGKSTLMRCLLGLEIPTQGITLIDGKPYSQLGDAPLREVGSFLDSAQAIPDRRAIDHLRWIAKSNGISKDRCLEVLEIVGLLASRRKRVREFSLGMKQRLSLAVALIGNPDYLVLDEPINGLDPDGIRWVRGLLSEFAASGKTVLVSSHYMRELEASVDRVVGLSHGSLVFDQEIGEILAAHRDLESAYFDLAGGRV